MHHARGLLSGQAFQRTPNLRRPLRKGNEALPSPICGSGCLAIEVLSVFPPPCPFCAHPNPTGAKFCNECGAPLHLRPCNRCEAVNNQVAKNCYKCGTALAMPSTEPEAAPVWPALGTAVASASLGDLCFESGQARLTESATESQDVGLRQSGDETAAARDGTVEPIAHGPRFPGEDMTLPVSTEDRAADAIPSHDAGAATGPHPLSRSALAVVLSAALLTAVGSAYYAYRNQTQLVAPLSTAPPNPAAPADVTAPPANPGVTPTTAAAGDDGQMPTPSGSDTTTTAQRITISDQAAPSQEAATEAAEVAKAPSATAPAQRSDTQAADVANAPSAAAPAEQPATQAAEMAKAPSATTAVAAQPRHKTLRTGARRRTATHSAANPSTSTNQDAAAAAPAQKKAKAKRKPVPKE